MSETRKLATGATPKAEATEPEQLVTIYPPAGELTTTAAALVAAADEAGYAQVQVVYSDGTFVVPEGLADAATLPEGATSEDVATEATQGTLTEGGTEEAGLPTLSNTRAEIDAYGTAHGIDTTGAASKAAAIELLSASE